MVASKKYIITKVNFNNERTKNISDGNEEQ